MNPALWGNYEFQPGFILAFHGCDESVGERILAGKGHLQWSRKVYDWLGHGIYFWEGNPQRAYEWAEARQLQGKIEKPFVLGAILDLGHCLDLFDSAGLRQVGDAYGVFRNSLVSNGIDIPRNSGATPDNAARHLDCATINFLHQYRQQSGLTRYDSVRAPFLEGDSLYPGAGFRVQTHIQICVRREMSIKGYFRPIAHASRLAHRR